MTWPKRLMMGPPELPLLMAASIWNISMAVLLAMVMLRSRAETMPLVME